MELNQKPITGNEVIPQKHSPMAALVSFYDAFNHGNMTLMSKNWANIPTIVMCNPLGGIVRGWNALQEVYKRIFSGPAQVYVEFYDYSLYQLGDTFLAVGRERGFLKLNGQHIELAIRTSRIYQKQFGQWKQVHHHGSIENPQLLHQYQQTVKQNN